MHLKKKACNEGGQDLPQDWFDLQDDMNAIHGESENRSPLYINLQARRQLRRDDYLSAKKTKTAIRAPLSDFSVVIAKWLVRLGRDAIQFGFFSMRLQRYVMFPLPLSLTFIYIRSLCTSCTSN